MPEEEVKQEQPSQGPSIETWFSRLQYSEKYMKDHFFSKMDLARKRLRSELYRETQGKGLPTHKQVNLVYSIGTSFVNSVIFKNPDVNLTARDDNETEQVENTEIKINDFLKDKKVKKTVQRAIWDAYLGGFGAFYTDYEYQDQQSEEPALDDAGRPMMESSVDEVGNPVENALKQRNVLMNGLSIQRIRPDLLRFPRGFDFDNAQESPWLGFDVLLPLEEVQQNENFDEEVRSKLIGSSFDSLSDTSEKRSNSKSSSDDLKWVKLSYVFQRPNGYSNAMKLMILCSEYKDKELFAGPYDKGHVGYPLKFIYFNPLDDDCSYPNGDPWIWESQLSAVDRWWKTLFNHCKRINPKIICDKNRVTTQDIQKLKSSEDLEYASIDAKGQPLETAFHQFEHSPVHQDVNLLYQSARELLSEISPKSGQSRGTQDSNTDTATAAKIVQFNESIDIDARIDSVRELFIDLVLDMAGILEKSFVGTTDIKGTLSNGTEIMRTVDRTGFTSKINVDVDVQSMQSNNREVYRRQLIDAVATLKSFSQDLARKGKAIDGEFFAEKIADSFGIRNIDKAFIDLNIRNAAKEEKEFVFGRVPFQVQDGENYEEHLMDHFQTYNDPLQMQTFEKLMPGFAETLGNHILETQQALKSQKQSDPKPKNPVSGERDPMATELGLANRT